MMHALGLPTLYHDRKFKFTPPPPMIRLLGPKY